MREVHADTERHVAADVRAVQDLQQPIAERRQERAACVTISA
jgi:hypothetical protein